LRQVQQGHAALLANELDTARRILSNAPEFGRRGPPASR
jgi:hypothetical protein